jgi:hypothetical protein
VDSVLRACPNCTQSQRALAEQVMKVAGLEARAWRRYACAPPGVLHLLPAGNCEGRAGCVGLSRLGVRRRQLVPWAEGLWWGCACFRVAQQGGGEVGPRTARLRDGGAAAEAARGMTHSETRTCNI